MLELSSAELDSRSILTTVLAGDLRLADRLEEAQLLPIASRIRARLRAEATGSAREEKPDPGDRPRESSPRVEQASLARVPGPRA
jgi:hypothetical protein